ncbi:MAG: NAD(P)/FAD-dependent oxidoreductase [Bdellovibrionales bacterium]
MTRNAVIVGGGPAGLIAAEILAQKGVKVRVYDSMPSVGRKFLLAGAHGGLNLTHSEPLADFIPRYGAASGFLEPCLNAFPPDGLRTWAQDLGQETFIGTSGRVFPVGMSAKPLLRKWLSRLETLGVSFVLKHRWQGWRDEGTLLFLNADAQEIDVKADAVLLALGGASWPRTGSDGSWYEILESANIPLTPLAPANCGFEVPWSSYISRFAGEPLKSATITFAGQSRQGDLMITDKGVEGGAIYALSAPIRRALEKDAQATLEIDLRPHLSVEELTERLNVPRKAQSFSTYLRKAAGINSLAVALLRECVPADRLPVNDVPALAELVKKLPLTVTRPAPLARAISTAGGVQFDALDDHFMLRAKPGVFVAGEMMDWEAPTGGYLMQGCFSTGAWAAQGLLKHLQQ